MIRMKLWPLIKRYQKIFIAISLMLALGVALVVGLVNACYTFDDAVDRYFDEYHFPELTVITQPFYAAQTNAEETEVLRGAQTRLVLDAQVTTDAGRLITGRCYFESREGLKAHYAVLESTSDSLSLVHARVDYCYSQQGGLTLGERITIKSELGTFDAIISEVCTGPENFVIHRNAFSFFDRTDFGYLYFDSSEVARALGVPALPQNQWLFDRGARQAEILSELSGRCQVLTSITRAESPQQEQADVCIAPIWSVSVALPSVIFLISIIIAALFMMQIIQEQRQEIGLLRALGYSSGRIAALYASFGLMVSLTATLVGFAGGTLLCGFVSDLYGKSFVLPKVEHVYRAAPYMLSLGIVLVTGQASTAISALLIARIDPTEAMRAVPKQKSAKLPAMRGWPELVKMQLRFALRNGRRTVLSILSIAMTGILLCFATSYSAALDSNIRDTLAQKYLFDVQICFDDWAAPDAIAERLSGVQPFTAVEYAGYQTSELSFEGKTANVILCGLSPDSQMIRVADEHGAALSLSSDGIVMAYHTAQELGVRIGDLVEVNGRHLPVTAISYQNVQYTQYMPFALLDELATEDAFTCAMGRMHDPSAEIELNNALQTVAHFDYVIYTRAIRAGLDSYVNTPRPAVVLVLACGLLIGYLIVYNLSAINMRERKRDYTILMTQGMRTASIVWSTFAELLAEFFISLGVTAAVGIPATRLLLEQMGTQYSSFRNPHMSETFWWVAALVIAYMAAANLMTMLPIRKIDLSDALKERE